MDKTVPELEFIPVDMDDLIEEVGDDLVAVVFEAFLEDMEGKLELLQAEATARNIEGIRKHAHRIKGCLISIRANKAAQKAKELEDSAQDGNLDEAIRLVPEFEREFLSAKSFVQNFILNNG